jgi:hypothetical protein
MTIERKLEKLGYGKTVTAIMIPLRILRTWTDEELKELRDFDVNIIVNEKIENYLRKRFANMGLKPSQVEKIFEDDNE